MNDDVPDMEAETRGYGNAAWNAIRTHGTAADPTTYAVWFAYARHSHPGLVGDLDVRLAQGSPTTADMHDLHRRYLSSEVDGQTVGNIAKRAQHELASALDALRIGAGDLGSSEGELKRALSALTKSEFSRADLQATLMAIANASARMAEANGALTKRLRSSEQRIAGLETDLGAARVQTLTDGLTGLSNRRAFDEHLTNLFDGNGAPVARPVLAMIDIDHFKAFNDEHGHVIGDQVIRFVASTLKEAFEPPTLTARYGGEEFAVVISEPDRAVPALEGFRQRISLYDLVQRGTNLRLGRVTVSVGATTMRSDDTPLSFVARADERLYAAKRSGRNRLVHET